MKFLTKSIALALMVGAVSAPVMADDIDLDFSVDFDMEATSSESLAPTAVDRDYVRGWIDYRVSNRYKDHPANDNPALNELRAQVETVNYFTGFETHLRVDGIVDKAVDENSVVAREAYASASPTSWMDIAVGRQIMLWNTADLIFVNDLFPKDYNSFYAGRDAEMEYLMLPVDGVNLSFYSDAGEFDVVYQPRFTPYATPTGERLSFYNPMAGGIVGENQVFEPQEREDYFDNDVWYLRYLTTLGPVEFGVYGYDGYWYQPNGFDTTTGMAYYPEMQSLGFSGRAALAGGIITGEAAYYRSPEDKDGTNPYVPNDSLRAYVGYEHEIVKNLTMGAQYYTERMQDYDQYVANGGTEDEAYDMYTVRLTQNLMKQTLTLSLFAFYSPTDEDAYTRVNVFYNPTDKWMVNVGVNEFGGKTNTTRFGQLEQNSTVFAAVRRKF